MINDLTPVSYTIFIDVHMKSNNTIILKTFFTIHNNKPPKVGDKINRNGVNYYEKVTSIRKNYTKNQKRIIKINNLKKE